MIPAGCLSVLIVGRNGRPAGCVFALAAQMKGYWPTCVSGIGVRDCPAGRVAVLNPHAPLSGPAGVCVRDQHGPVAAYGVRGGSNVPRRACHGIHHAPVGMLPGRSGSRNAGLRMPRHTPHGGRGRRDPSGGQYIEPRMPGHAQTAGHGPEPPLPVDICSVSHAVAYRMRTQAGTMIQAPTRPTSRHASWPITPGEGIPARLRSRRPNLARCSGRSPKNSRIRPSAARLERLFGISRVRTCFREMF